MGALRRLSMAMAAASTAALLTSAAAADSAFGCRDLMHSKMMPSVEGDAGQFYRIDPDLVADHRMPDTVVSGLARLSRALADRGTTLIYVPLPTKALAMPEFLPPEARVLGYDPDIGATLYDGTVQALRSAGVMTLDARAALRRTRAGDMPFFRTDPRLTAAGAKVLGSILGDMISGLPDYDDHPKIAVRGARASDEVLTSHMRLLLQENCSATLPMLRAEHHTSVVVGSGTAITARSPSEIAQGDAPVIVSVGTEISGLPYSNFTGFLAAFSLRATAGVTVKDGGAYAAMASYLTSDAFQMAPPAYLVWTNPVWYGLATHGDQPMRELQAAAGAQCDLRMPLSLSEDRRAATAAFPFGTLDPSLSLRLEAAAPVRRIRFEFASGSGLTRIRTVERPAGAESSGRVFMPLSGLWPGGPTAVTVALDQPMGPDATLTLCTEPTNAL